MAGSDCDIEFIDIEVSLDLGPVSIELDETEVCEAISDTLDGWFEDVDKFIDNLDDYMEEFTEWNAGLPPG